MYYGKKVNLRLLTLEDADFIIENFNNLEIMRTTGSVLPLSKEEEIEWIKSSWEAKRKGTRYVFAVTKKTGEMIGTVDLFKISHLHQSAEIGIAIYPKENHNQGYGTDAVITMCAFGFLYANFNTIYLRFLEFNLGGHKAYEKAGFSNLSREREAVYREGKFVDVMRMDILRSEWMEKFPDYDLKEYDN